MHSWVKLHAIFHGNIGKGFKSCSTQKMNGLLLVWTRVQRDKRPKEREAGGGRDPLRPGVYQEGAVVCVW